MYLDHFMKVFHKIPVFLAVQNSSIGDLVTDYVTLILLLTYKERP